MKKLGFGIMRMPLTNENDPASIDLKKSGEMIDRFMKAGFNYFDTAYPYHNGMSERALKELLVKKYPRDSFVIADKLPSFLLKKSEDCERIFREQLERTGVEYFDIYLIHDLGAVTYETAKETGAFEFIEKMKKEGRVKLTGFSFHDSVEVLERILDEHPEVDIVQLQVNYVDWDSDSVEAEKCCELCKKRGKKIVVMEPVKGGMLARIPEEAEKLLLEHKPDMSIPSWAIRFCAGVENVICVLSGMSNMEQLNDNISYMSDFKPLTAKERELLKKAEAIIKANVNVPCTGCAYCVSGCPMEINIPRIFLMYNGIKIYGNLSHQRHYYRNYVLDHARATDCIECGACEEICPQHIKIREELKKAAMQLEV